MKATLLRRNWFARLGLVMAVAFTVGFTSMHAETPASAGAASGEYGIAYTAPHWYAYFGQVITGAGTAQAVTVEGGYGPTVGLLPPGYAAARGRLLRCGSPNIWADGTNTFNTTTGGNATGWTFNHSVSRSIAWDAWGVVYQWNGSSYNAFYAPRSPCQNS